MVARLGIHPHEVVHDGAGEFIIHGGIPVEINGKHPFWSIIRLVVIFAGLTTFLAINSDNFDKTEVTTILELLVLVAGFEGVKKAMAAKKEEE